MSESSDDAPYLPSSSASPNETRSITGVHERHQEVIRLLERHISLREIANITVYRLRTVQHIVQRYRTLGRAALRDGRAHGQGMTPLVTPSMQRELQQLLQHPPPDGGSWTGPKVAHWMAARTGKPVARQRGWEYLQRFRTSNAEPTDPRDDLAACESETRLQT